VAGTPFLAVLERLAAADPDRPAVTCGSVTRTRAEFLDRVTRVAGLFAAHGVVQGSTVAIGLANSAEFVESMFATWALGAVPLPISDRLPSVERAAIIDLADPALVVGVATTDTGGRPAIVALPTDLPAGSFTPGMSPMWRMMTSGGSTGRPKVIALPEPATIENLAGLGAIGGYPTDGCVLATTPLYHSTGFAMSSIGLLFGNHVIVMPRFDAAETLRLIEQHHVEWVALVPTMMSRIWHLPEPVRQGADLSSLNMVFHTAAPCPMWLKEAWIGWVGPDKILELFGGTEFQAGTIITGTEWLAHRGSVGRPFVGELSIRDPDGRPLPEGEPGEIWMRRGAGAPPSYRYIGATARTAEDGWESLGDIGYLNSDGYLYVTDRMADMILVGGANVYPAEIEAALDEHPAVLSCCVIGLPDDDMGNVPHAIVELSQPTSDDELLVFLKARIAPYKLPRSIERAAAPLRDDAGKVRRYALRAERLP
jgi:bile acid-coenzyme A ligase